ncbi:hypothetical protein KSP40_PGU000297 [Platanthera guangdongensis]|uniref:Uncharacterized protein n=1 Tax=Platanthera guangdongensis TaxID=2320717 RepID=A0ABR2LW77_9ASPA
MALQVEQQTQNFCTFMFYFSSVDIAKYTLTMVYEFLKHLHIHFRSRVNSRRHMKMEFLKQNQGLAMSYIHINHQGQLQAITRTLIFRACPIHPRVEALDDARKCERVESAMLPPRDTSKSDFFHKPSSKPTTQAPPPVLLSPRDILLPPT